MRRILAARCYWTPRLKINGLVRYAFLGDSNVYGQGVAADESFPACAERLLNESIRAPVEAVNLGVPGYNIWNSWQSFRAMPQVYDALVLALCSNDAQLFNRTYRINYKNMDPPLWEPEHAFQRPLAACFDEMANFCRSIGLPIVVCYYGLWAGDRFQRIAEITKRFCESRTIAFIDLHQPLAERRIAAEDRVVGPADAHPSVLAHQLAARHLVASLEKLGWFSPSAATANKIGETVPSICEAMVAKENYPVDAALGWANGVLQTKRRAALRSIEVTEASATEFDEPLATIERTEHAWHRRARTAASVERLMSVERGFSGPINRIEEETLRLDELLSAVDGGWESLSSALPAPLPIPPESALDARGAREALDVQREALRQLRQTLNATRDNAGGIWLLDRQLEAYMADLAQIETLADAVNVRLENILGTLERAETRIATSRDASALAQQSASAIIENLRHGVQALNACIADRPPPRRAITTVELLLDTNRVEGRHPCMVDAHATYRTPRRLPMRDQRYFLPDGQQTRVKLQLPLFYSGRLAISFRCPPEIADLVQTRILGLEVFNRPDQRWSASPADLMKEGAERFISPQIILCD